MINQLIQLTNTRIHISTIKMKAVDVKSSTSINFNKENDKNPKFKVGDHVRILKYNIFAKGYIPKWSVEVCVI